MRVSLAGAEALALRPARSDRPAGRFNPPGRGALYLAPDAESARVAIGGTVREGDGARVLTRYAVGPCRLVDLRRAPALYEISRQPWREALAERRTPPSWRVAEIVRAAGLDGLIDPSRRRPGLWLVTLLRWSGAGPRVRRLGPAAPIHVAPGHR